MIKFIVARERGNQQLYADNLEQGLKRFGFQVFQAMTQDNVPEESKPKKYNTTIDALWQNNLIVPEDIICFCNEDIMLLDTEFPNKIQMIFNQTQVSMCGVLGSSELNDSGEWWMTGPEFQRGHIMQSNGAQAEESHHLVKGQIGFFTDVVAIDRGFMAIRASELTELRFDDSFALDFYNTDICLQLLDSGKSIGVADILLGQAEIPANKSDTPEWQERRNALMNKWQGRGYTFPLTINSFERKDVGVVEIEL